MTDRVSAETRSSIMRRVKGENTKPEIIVRSSLHRAGLRFRLHPKKLPGHPDIILPKYKAVVFVHGCFWHRHPECKNSTTPNSNLEYWLPKFARTVERDNNNSSLLVQMGWRVFIIWECEINEERLSDLCDEIRDFKN